MIYIQKGLLRGFLLFDTFFVHLQKNFMLNDTFIYKLS